MSDTVTCPSCGSLMSMTELNEFVCNSGVECSISHQHISPVILHSIRLILSKEKEKIFYRLGKLETSAIDSMRYVTPSIYLTDDELSEIYTRGFIKMLSFRGYS